MENTEVRTRFQVTDAPEDLLLFQARMASLGITVRLPATGARFTPLTTRPPINADEWAEAIVRRRDGR